MKYFFFSLVCISLLSGAQVVYGQAQYTPIVGDIPGLSGTNNTTEDYVNALYTLAITVAALIAVVKIILGGVQYMLSDVVTSKGEAVKNIKGALLGLLIVLSAVLILQTINRNLLTISIFNNAPGIGATQSPTNTNSDVPDHLQPGADERLNVMPCDNSSGTPNCTNAQNSCRNQGGSYNRSNENNGSVYCYTQNNNNGSSCDGYRDPNTNECYGSTIDLGSDFANQPGNIREAECARRGGSLNYANGVCTRN